MYIRGKNDPEPEIYGTHESDWIEALLGDDVVYGGSGGDDTIYAGLEAPDPNFPNHTDNDRVYGDTFAGGNTHDTIWGGYGNDILYGDSYAGGTGNDTIYGGLDNDTLYGGGGNDHLDGDAGDDVIYGEGGDDYLFGDVGADKLYGGSDNDTLSGSDFPGVDYADQLYGGSGDDTYQEVDGLDTVIENAGEGIDTVYSLANHTLSANVENLRLSHPSSATRGTGNSLNNLIVGNSNDNSLYGLLGDDTLEGNGGNDTLDGGDSNDVLSGGAGDDYLLGRAGADQMRGGANNDKYVVDNASDVVIENASEGMDTVVTTINYSLGANVENLTLTDAATKGTGNDLNNTLLGTAGSNILSAKDGDDILNGRGGDDVLVGGAGKDTLYGDTGADKFRFVFQSERIDLIKDFNQSEGDKIQIIKSSFGATSLDQFSYNSTTGALLFESTQIATITNKPAGFSVQTDLILQ